MSEFQQIMQHIHARENFLLSGGAGSGKTYSLVQVIKQVIEENPTSKIACMTYTNAAVKEIEERVNHKNLNVTTIHEFLWDNIKQFQKEIKKTLVDFINDPNNSKFEINEAIPISIDYFKEDIVYSYLATNLLIGRISHDEVLLLSNALFQNHKKLCDILKDKYKFIFIDEYQDTQKEVIQIFLEHLIQSTKQTVIGFFGDSMQAIYDDGVGDISNYVTNGSVKEVIKVQNRRNPQLVIDLANELRTDGVRQEPSSDPDAPNMENGIVKQGKIRFYYSTNRDDLERLKNEILGWDFHYDSILKKIKSKELNLTHNLIADKAGFRTLMDIYDKDKIIDYKKRIRDYIKDKSITTDFSSNTFGEVIEILKTGKTGTELNRIQPTYGQQEFINSNLALFTCAENLPYPVFTKTYIDKDQLLDDKKQDEEDESKKSGRRDELMKHLHKIQNVIYLYINKNYNEFLKNTEKKIKSIADKVQLKSDIESIINVGNKSIEQVIQEAHDNGICLIGDKLTKFKQDKVYIYNRVKDVPFSEFQRLYEYLEGRTPFSTQHKTKGTEFDNVLVVLDSGGWRNYDFDALFANTRTDRVMKRSQKIFYVCCTRTKENLAVFYHSQSRNVINQAINWFGQDNVINMEDKIKTL